MDLHYWRIYYELAAEASIEVNLSRLLSELGFFNGLEKEIQENASINSVSLMGFNVLS